MWVVTYSRQHRRRLGGPVRIRVACAGPAPAQLRIPYHPKLGSALVPIAVPRAMQGSVHRAGPGHPSVGTDDSRGSELPNTAGGVAVRVPVCSQCSESRLLRCGDFMDISLGYCPVLRATVECVVRAPSTIKPMQADRAGSGRVCRGFQPDAQHLRYGSPAKLTDAGLGRKCLACPTRTRRDTWRPLKQRLGRDSLRRASRNLPRRMGQESRLSNSAEMQMHVAH